MNMVHSKDTYLVLLENWRGKNGPIRVLSKYSKPQNLSTASNQLVN